MIKQLLSGNEAIARGAFEAGCKVAAGYPGTPSTEILEVLSQYKDHVYCEWSPNEKVAFEVAVGASLTGTGNRHDEARGPECRRRSADDFRQHGRDRRFRGLRGRRSGHALLAKRARHAAFRPIRQNSAFGAGRFAGSKRFFDPGDGDFRRISNAGHFAHDDAGQPFAQRGRRSASDANRRNRSAFKKIRRDSWPFRNSAG